MILLLLGEGLLTYVAIQTIESDVSSKHLEIAKRAEAVISQSLTHFYAQQKEIADSVGQNETQADQIFSLALKNNPEFEQIAFTDARGMEIMRLNRLSIVTSSELSNYGQNPQFQEAREKNGLLGGVFFSERAEPLIKIFIPLYTLTGTFNGMLITDLNLRFMWDLVREIRVGERGKVYVVDKKGALIADPDSSLVLRGENVLARPIVQKVLRGESPVDGLDPSDGYADNGTQVFATGLQLKAIGWGIITQEPLDEAMAARQKTLVVGIASSFATVIIFFLLFIALRKLFELTRSLEEERLHTTAIISNLVDGLIEYSPTMHIILVNAQAEILLGIKKTALLNKTVEEATAGLEGEQRDAFMALFSPSKNFQKKKLFLESTDYATDEITINQPLKRTLKVITIPIVDVAGRVISNGKIIRDISREKLLDQLKSEFISIAAHQLRTPLSAVKWTLRLLLDGDMGDVPRNQLQYLQAGYDINERMIRLVDDLLNVSRIEEGRFTYKFQKENIASLIEDMVKSFREIAEKKDIIISFQKPSTPLSLLSIDRDKIAIVLQNLIENALSYTPAKGKITVALEENPDNIVVSIKDTGIGISPEDIPRLFTKFYRVPGSDKMHPNGSGLGLFVGKNIIMVHGGEIFVESKIGEGTTFRFTLPKKRPFAVPETI